MVFLIEESEFYALKGKFRARIRKDAVGKFLWMQRNLLMVATNQLMKAGFPRVDIKFTDRIAYYNAFDEYEYHVKHNLSAMANLLAGYINARLVMYLDMLQD